MSQRSGIKRSARALEKEACANVSADDIVCQKIGGSFFSSKLIERSHLLKWKAKDGR